MSGSTGRKYSTFLYKVILWKAAKSCVSEILQQVNNCLSLWEFLFVLSTFIRTICAVIKSFSAAVTNKWSCLENETGTWWARIMSHWWLYSNTGTCTQEGMWQNMSLYPVPAIICYQSLQISWGLPHAEARLLAVWKQPENMGSSLLNTPSI